MWYGFKGEGGGGRAEFSSCLHIVSCYEILRTMLTGGGGANNAEKMKADVVSFSPMREDYYNIS